MKNKAKWMPIILLPIILIIIFLKTGTKGSCRIGISISNYNDNFMALYREELRKDLDGIECEYEIRDAEGDIDLQKKQIEELAQQYDVLIIDPVYENYEYSDILKDDPAVFIRYKPLSLNDRSCYIGFDPIQSLILQGDLVLKRKDQGDLNKNGILDYIHVYGDEPLDPNNDPSVSSFKDSDLKINRVSDIVTYWDRDIAYNKVREVLETNDIDVIFCDNDNIAMGVLEAAQESAKEILIIGRDGAAECQEMISEGRIYATLINDHYTQASMAVYKANDLCNNKKVDPEYLIGFITVTR